MNVDMFKETLAKISSNPVKAIRTGFALLRGFLVKARHMTNPNVKIGSNFRAFTWPRIIGPGKVIIGNKVNMRLSFFRQPCILTHTKDAMVIIGNDSTIAGTRISCVDSVTIGYEALLGSMIIIDSDIIPTEDIIIDAKWKEAHAQPIKIGNHVWAGLNACILSGTVLGDECVLGAGAVIQYKEVPERSLLVGNPARKIGFTRTV
jgi:acetyltransferase-like isoleucine patch superfamily enzyme